VVYLYTLPHEVAGMCMCRYAVRIGVPLLHSLCMLWNHVHVGSTYRVAAHMYHVEHVVCYDVYTVPVTAHGHGVAGPVYVYHIPYVASVLWR
jgi:hypothetical protein